MKLTNDEKAKIREEEKFRLALIEQLTKPKPKPWWKAVWDLLNSNFVLWALSSVVLAWISYEFTEREQKKKDSARLVQLREEIAKDFWEFSGAIDIAWDFTNYSNCFAKFLQRPAYHYSDFKDKPMGELIWLMGSLPPEEPEKARQIENAINDIWIKIARHQYEFTLEADVKGELDESIGRIIHTTVLPILQPSAQH